MSVFGDDLTDSIIEGHLTLETSESEKLRFLRNVETLCFDRPTLLLIMAISSMNDRMLLTELRS